MGSNPGYLLKSFLLKRFNVNYGSLGILDEFHGTDALFKKSKEFNRHVTLTSLKSARELIPDD